MKRGFLSIAAVVSAAACFAGCSETSVIDSTTSSGEAPVPAQSIGIVIGGDSPEYRLTDETMISTLKESATGVNALNSSLIDVVSGNNQKSAMVSGFSAYSCLSSAAKYIRGNSKEQINNALGVIDTDALDYFKTHMPIETGTLFLIDDDTVLNAAKSDDFVFRDLQSGDIVDYVNTFTAEKTHNLVPQLISMPFSSDCRAVVLDTLYFKGSWEHEFPKEATKKQTFHGLSGDVETDFMHTTHDYGVNVDDSIIELRYKNSDLVMDICYDTNGSAADAFDKYVSNLDSLNSGLDYSYDVNLAMPKFETESNMSVVEAYESLGMTDMFNPACSEDFSMLADDIYISDIKQKTKIIVDEEGTEAAAVTMIAMSDSCAVSESKVLDIIIDKPFAYAIRDRKTNIILFAGYVNDF